MKRTLLALLAVLIVCAGVAFWALRDAPIGQIVDGANRPVIVLENSEGKVLVQKGPSQSAYAAREEFPDHLVHAVLSIEDRDFYSHAGIDLEGIGRAFVRNVVAGELVEGGSTITQQLLKIQYLGNAQTFKRKIQEALLAIWLETRLSKDEILTRYLNNVYLGAGATGMSAASLIYFGKPVSELTLPESALLAGLIRAPSRLNPMVNPEGARERAHVVLGAMSAAGYLTQDELMRATLASAQLNPSQSQASSGSWFADWALAEARELAGPFRGAISARTTLDPELQAIAEKAVTDALAEKGEKANVSQAALVAMRPDGAVVAMVGGRSYESTEFNRALAHRQPGSTFKLFVYYAALKTGFSTDDRIKDTPIEIDGWTPENYSGRYHGSVTLAQAFANSFNAASVRLAMEVGIDNIAEVARTLGIDAELTETPSLALGASEVSLLDLTGAFASVRAGVAPVEPWGIASFAPAEGDTRFRIGPTTPADIELEHQAAMVRLLERVVDEGTGTRAQLEGFAAGKTGTSTKYRDAWFIGFNEEFVVGVWAGNDDGEPMDSVTGGELPAAIWHDFMTAAADAPDTPEATVTSEAAAPDEPTQTSEAVAPDEPGADAGPAEDTPPRSEPTGLEGILPPRSDGLPHFVRDEDGESAEVRACNVRACSRAYRSFRASDCTYQPYSGPRTLCTR